MIKLRSAFRDFLLISFITLLLLELTLQGLALINQYRFGYNSNNWANGKLKVLALGDSNTFGLYLKAEEAWPIQFEKQWNSDPSRPSVDVINLGYPGNTSSRIQSQFESLITTFNPDITLIMIGVNDGWSAPLDFEPFEDSWKKTTVNWLKQHLRSYQLARHLYRNYKNESIVVNSERHIGFGFSTEEELIEARQQFAKSGKQLPKFDPDEASVTYGDKSFRFGLYSLEPSKEKRDLTYQNLKKIQQIATSYNTRVILVTYAANSSVYSLANSRMKAVGEKVGIPVIDIAEAFQPECIAPRCTNLLFYDQHPKASGYQRIAEIIVHHKDLLLTSE